MPDTNSKSASRNLRLGQWMVAEGFVIAMLAIWWIFSQTSSYAFPMPQSVLAAIGQLLFDPAFAIHSVTTILRILIAISLAMVLGGCLALLPRYVPEFDGFIHERVKPILNSFPSVGWALLGSVWFGVSWAAVVFVQTAILIPFTLINISEGLKELGRDEQEMARSFTRGRWRSFRLVIFPMLYPYLITAVRISYGVAWKVSLIAELFGARVGLGVVIMDAQTNNRLDLIFAVCLIIVLFYVVGEKLVLEPLSRLYGAGAARPSR